MLPALHLQEDASERASNELLIFHYHQPLAMPVQSPVPYHFEVKTVTPAALFPQDTCETQPDHGHGSATIEMSHLLERANVSLRNSEALP